MEDVPPRTSRLSKASKDSSKGSRMSKASRGSLKAFRESLKAIRERSESSRTSETSKSKQKGSFEYVEITTPHDRLKLNALILYISLVTSTNYVMLDYMLNIHTRKFPNSGHFTLQIILFVTPQVGVLFAFFTDCAFEDFRVELVVSILGAITTMLATVMNFFYPFSMQTLYYSYIPFFIQYATTSNSWSFILYQLRHMKADVDKVLFTCLCGHMMFLSIFKSCTEVIRYFFNDAFLSYFFTFWQSTVTLLRIGILILLYKYIRKHYASFGHFATVALVTIDMIINKFKKKSKKTFQDVDIFYTKRFWKVLCIMLFFVPFGLGTMTVFVVLNNLTDNLVKGDSLLENFQCFYFFGGFVGTLIYFFMVIPLLKKKGIIIKELKNFGIALGMVVLDLILLGILQSIVLSLLGTIPNKGNFQIRLYNLINSSVTINSELLNTTLSSYSMITFSQLTSPGQYEMEIQIHAPEYQINEKTSILGLEAKSTVYAINRDGLKKLQCEEKVPKNTRGRRPLVYLLPTAANVTLEFKKGNDSKKLETDQSKMKAQKLEEGQYEIQTIEPEKVHLINFDFYMDSIYSALIFEPITEGGIRIFTIRNPRTVDIKWVIPIAFLMALADMIQWYTLMKLAIYQGPPHLRTFVIAIGDMLVRASDFIHFFPSLHEDKAGYGLFIFVILTIVIVSLSIYIYHALKYVPYVFTTHGKF